MCVHRCAQAVVACELSDPDIHMLVPSTAHGGSAPDAPADAKGHPPLDELASGNLGGDVEEYMMHLSPPEAQALHGARLDGTRLSLSDGAVLRVGDGVRILVEVTRTPTPPEPDPDPLAPPEPGPWPQPQPVPSPHRARDQRHARTHGPRGPARGACVPRAPATFRRRSPPRPTRVPPPSCMLARRR